MIGPARAFLADIDLRHNLICDSHEILIDILEC